MLIAAFVLLAVAVLMGSLLAVMHLRADATPPAWPLGAVHALVALGGFGGLLLALRGPPRGLDQGTSAFGAIAAALLALAALAGLALVAARLRKGKLAGGLIGLHAALAVGGFVILAAYVLAG